MRFGYVQPRPLAALDQERGHRESPSIPSVLSFWLVGLEDTEGSKI